MHDGSHAHAGRSPHCPEFEQFRFCGRGEFRGGIGTECVGRRMILCRASCRVRVGLRLPRVHQRGRVRWRQRTGCKCWRVRWRQRSGCGCWRVRCAARGEKETERASENNKKGTVHGTRADSDLIEGQDLLRFRKPQGLIAQTK